MPHYHQEAEAGCLPTCPDGPGLGIFRSQASLARRLGLRPRIGVPASSLTRLRSAGIEVVYTSGDLDDLANWLERDQPAIAFVQTRQWPYWQGHTAQHAVVVVGLDDIAVYVSTAFS